MGNVINLANYKRRTRQSYLIKYESRIDRIIESFVRLHLDVDFQQLAEDYQAGRYGVEQASWDYVHFREILAEALDEAFGRALYDMLRAQHWFDSGLIRQDEIIERCLSTYVLGRCQAATKP